MFHSNRKLLFLLLLLNGTSLTMNKNDNELSTQDSSGNFFSGMTEKCCDTLLEDQLFKQFSRSLPTLKFLIARWAQAYIKCNAKQCPEFIADVIAECLTSPIAKHKKEKTDDDDEKKDSFKYVFPYKTFLYSVPKTVARETIFYILTKTLHKTTETFDIKHPPEIEKNQNFCQSGKFIVASITRQKLDETLHNLWEKTTLGQQWKQQ